MPTDLREQIEEIVSSFRADVDPHLSAWLNAKTPNRFSKLGPASTLEDVEPAGDCQGAQSPIPA